MRARTCCLLLKIMFCCSLKSMHGRAQLAWAVRVPAQCRPTSSWQLLHHTCGISHHLLVARSYSCECTHASSKALDSSASPHLLSAFRAAIQLTQPHAPCVGASRPSMHRSEDWEVSAALRGARASSSSKNSTQGAAARARLNSCLTARSLSPTHLFSSSGPCTPMHLLGFVDCGYQAGQGGPGACGCGGESRSG